MNIWGFSQNFKNIIKEPKEERTMPVDKEFFIRLDVAAKSAILRTKEGV